MSDELRVPERLMEEARKLLADKTCLSCPKCYATFEDDDKLRSTGIICPECSRGRTRLVGVLQRLPVKRELTADEVARALYRAELRGRIEQAKLTVQLLSDAPGLQPESSTATPVLQGARDAFFKVEDKLRAELAELETSA